MAKKRGATPSKCTEQQDKGLPYAQTIARSITRSYERRLRGSGMKTDWYNPEALSSNDEEAVEYLAQDKYITAVVLLHGAPPPHPDTNDFIEFGNYIHDLGKWTIRARGSLFEFWSIDERMYEQTPVYRKAFDLCLQKFYTLKYEGEDDGR